MKKLSKVECSWLACAIDSEGSIIIAKAYRKGNGAIYVPMVNVSNTNLKYIKKCDALIKRATGGSFQNKHNDGVNKKIYRVCISSFPRVISLLNMLLPYFIIKKDRAKNLINWAKYRQYKKTNHIKNTYDKKDIEFIKKGRRLETSKWKNKKLIDRVKV